MVDHHVRRPATTLRRRSRVAEHRVGERVGRVRILGFVRLHCSRASRNRFPVPLSITGFDRATDLRGDLEVAFDHPVRRRPHPKRPGRMLALRPLRLVFAPGSRRDAPRRVTAPCPWPPAFDQLPLDRRVIRRPRRRSDPSPGPTTVPARTAASVAGNDSSFAADLDRPLRLARADTPVTRAHSSAAFRSAVVGVRRGVLDPLRRLGQHPVDQAAGSRPISSSRSIASCPAARAGSKSRAATSSADRAEQKVVQHHPELYGQGGTATSVAISCSVRQRAGGPRRPGGWARLRPLGSRAATPHARSGSSSQCSTSTRNEPGPFDREQRLTRKPGVGQLTRHLVGMVEVRGGEPTAVGAAGSRAVPESRSRRDNGLEVRVVEEVAAQTVVCRRKPRDRRGENESIRSARPEPTPATRATRSSDRPGGRADRA